MKIRKATSADIPLMMDLERSSATAAHWPEDQYQRMFAHDAGGVRGLCLVAEDSGPACLAGSASLLGFLVARNVGPEWELENIVVASQAQRHGIGTQLLHGFLAEASQTGNPVVFLEVRESNAAARALYEKSGFSQVGRRSAYYYHPSEDAVVYRWTAPQPFSE